jgi:hypothetical protein
MTLEEAKDAVVECVETNSHASVQTDEEKALVRKIDLCLLPTIWLMYLLSYMDVSSRLSIRPLYGLLLSILVAYKHWQRKSGRQ